MGIYIHQINGGNNMNRPSYFETRLDVLEAFYSFLIQKGYGLNMNCEDVLGYLSYDYEEGYSKMATYRDWETDRKSTRLNSSHITRSRMPSSA